MSEDYDDDCDEQEDDEWGRRRRAMRFRGRWHDGHNNAHVSHNALELKPPRLNSSPTSTRLYNNRIWIVPEVAASHARVLKAMNAAAMGIVNSLQC